MIAELGLAALWLAAALAALQMAAGFLALRDAADGALAGLIRPAAIVQGVLVTPLELSTRRGVPRDFWVLCGRRTVCSTSLPTPGRTRGSCRRPLTGASLNGAPLNGAQ